MEIRKATINDYDKLKLHLRKNDNNFINKDLLLDDILGKYLYVLIDNDKFLAMCSIVPDYLRGLSSLKRLIVFNKNNRGKHYASILINGITQNKDLIYSATPWVDNIAVRKVLEKCGFSYKYTFQDIWLCYQK